LAVTCNLGVVYSITSDRGLAAGGAQNYLTFGSQKLAYSLLVGGASGTFDPAASGQPQTEIASGKLDAFSLVVNVPAAQMVPVGPYTDTVTFSLNY
jgi:spore coat protein U-like protein